MPQCKQCKKEFTRERDTKKFCSATCRSLYRYHKNKNNSDEIYDNGESNERTEDRYVEEDF